MLVDGDVMLARAAPDDTAATAAASRWVQRMQWLMLGVAPTILGIGAWSHRWSSDDGFINYRIVEQLFAGNGLVFNAGERVEAGTSPLWLGILAVGRGVAGWWVDIGWIAVVLGIVLSVAGLAAAQLGARALLGADRRGLVVPAGALVLASLPVMWDFATSGLETGLWFGWLGLCFWLVARRAMEGSGAGEPTGRRDLLVPVLLGLGPLVRPDFTLYSAGFVGAWLVLTWRGWRHGVAVVAAALSVPVLYEVFRMGYFGALVPTTALAKEAGRPEWGRGVTYVRDFAGATWIVVPVLAAAVLGVAGFVRARRRAGRPAIVVVAVLIPALVHFAYLVRVGGDFMHGRFLLAPLFVALLPVAVVAFPSTKRFVQLGALVVLVAWCAASIVVVRVPYGGIGPEGIANERGFWSGLAGVGNPVTVDDYRMSYAAVLGSALSARARNGDDVIVRGNDEIVGRSRQGTGVYEANTSIGVLGFRAGTDVHIVDVLGLADPVAARLVGEQADGRTGHRKHLDDVWTIAEHGAPDAGGADVATARAALACEGPAAMRASISEPLTLGQVIDNIRGAVTSTRLRIPADPDDALEQLCE